MDEGTNLSSLQDGNSSKGCKIEMPAPSRANKQAVIGRDADGTQPPTVLCFHYAFHRCNASGDGEVMTLKPLTGLSVKQITVSSH